MDEKRASAPAGLLSHSFSRRPRIFSLRRLLLAITLTGIIFYSYPAISSLPQRIPSLHPIQNHEPAEYQTQEAAPKTQSSLTKNSASSTKVSLEAHLMSKCSDARDCLRDLVVPAMSEISSLVDFKLFYIGTPSSTDDSVQCKHGPTECLGNTVSLCVQELYANNSQASLGFTNCLLMDYKQIPARELIQGCALEHAVDFDAVNKCVSENGRGEQLLRDSVLASKERGVKLSCSVRLSDKMWCVRDNKEWKQCGSHGPGVSTLVEEVRKRAARAG